MSLGHFHVTGSGKCFRLDDKTCEVPSVIARRVCNAEPSFKQCYHLSASSFSDYLLLKPSFHFVLEGGSWLNNSSTVQMVESCRNHLDSLGKLSEKQTIFFSSGMEPFRVFYLPKPAGHLGAGRSRPANARCT